MKTLSIDTETYSSTPLQKSGVYRYVEADDFEILLFGYSVDSGPVQVVDLACGEHIPKEILQALEDDDVIKWAFNATFERICLSRFLGYPSGDYLDPEGWRCSMIWAATMGLPLSLEGVGAVLGLEKQKLTEGKDLIKYFCQPCAPTKSNGQRTRNRPFQGGGSRLWGEDPLYPERHPWNGWRCIFRLCRRWGMVPCPEVVGGRFLAERGVQVAGERKEMCGQKSGAFRF